MTERRVEGAYRIGEVARAVGLTRQTLHHYVELGLLRPVGVTPGGHRLFGGSVFRRIEEIRARRPGLTLAALREQGRASRGRRRRRP